MSQRNPSVLLPWDKATGFKYSNSSVLAGNQNMAFLTVSGLILTLTPWESNWTNAVYLLHGEGRTNSEEGACKQENCVERAYGDAWALSALSKAQHVVEMMSTYVMFFLPSFSFSYWNFQSHWKLPSAPGKLKAAWVARFPCPAAWQAVRTRNCPGTETVKSSTLEKMWGSQGSTTKTL